MQEEVRNSGVGCSVDLIHGVQRPEPETKQRPEGRETRPTTDTSELRRSQAGPGLGEVV